VSSCPPYSINAYKYLPSLAYARLWNPFLALLCTVFMYLMRPVPVVFLLMALTDQLNFLIFEAGYPQDEHVVFCLWKERLPQRLHSVCVFV